MALNIDSKTAGDIVAVSGVPQADAETAATINKLIVFDDATFLRQQRNAETNEAEKTGFVEATDVDIISKDAVGQLSQAKATPDALAWMIRMIAGAATSAAAGTGYKHDWRLTSYPDEPAYFTAAHRRGGASSGSAPAALQRFRGMAIGSLELRAAKNEFFTTNAAVVGTGNLDDGLYTEVVASVDFSTTPTAVLSFDVQPAGGADEAEQATHIWGMADMDDDGVYETPFNCASYVDSTKTATLEDVGSGSHSVRITYLVDDAETGTHPVTGEDWTWIAEVTGLSAPTEFFLKASNMRLYLGQAIDATGGTVSVTGGQYQTCELDEFTYSFDRSAEPGRCWRVLAAADSEFAQQVELGDIIQRITLSRRVRDWLLKQNYDDNSVLGVQIDAVGPLYDGSNRFEFHLYFPYCKVLTLEQDVSDGKHRDTVELAVLQDPVTSGQPTMAAVVQNEQATYA